MSKGMLIDLTRCVACRGCQVACKQWNTKPGEATKYSQNWTNPADMSGRTWTVVDIRAPEIGEGEATKWRFVKRQCLHCIDPACVSACSVKALTRDENGPVVYHPDRCFGCRYCMVACPFGIPKFEWWNATPTIQKCQFCVDRLEQGKEPACATTCVADAITYGERDDLLVEAKTRVFARGSKYVPHIYGEKEAGGTAVMYVSDVPFTQLGFPAKVKNESYPAQTKDFLLAVPLVLISWPALLAGLNSLVRLRERGMREEMKERAKAAGTGRSAQGDEA